MTRIHRRQFITAAGISLGATALTCAGLGYLAVRTPAQTVNFYEHMEEGEYKNDMKRKVLIAYASKLGSTGEVAQAIGEQLTARGFVADVLRVGDVKDVAPYNSFLLGSAVRMGRWLPEAVGFLEQNAGSFAGKSVFYFSVCMTMREDTPENRSRALPMTNAARAIREPNAEEFFGGRMDYSKLPFLEQAILRAKKIPEGDFHDWDAIRAWAGKLPNR
ncbi:MAG: flavodoxin domain-containing protein [Anaerolineales bacterium]|nr:flavodoxin domain-containing protein [Anaerolineales bacterium]